MMPHHSYILWFYEEIYNDEEFCALKLEIWVNVSTDAIGDVGGVGVEHANRGKQQGPWFFNERLRQTNGPKIENAMRDGSNIENLAWRCLLA